MRQLLVPLLLTAALAACTPPPKPAADPGHRVQYSKEGKFEDVRDDLKTAIQNRGLVIDHTSHIHNMLERTGKDIGQTAKVFKDAEAFSFCSATVSRGTMEADPHNIVFCPYTITAYVTEKEPGKVYVAFRRLQPVGSDASKASLKAVHDLLDGIAREAIGK